MSDETQGQSTYGVGQACATRTASSRSGLIPGQLPLPVSHGGAHLQRCLECDFTTPYTYVLKKHRKMHIGERPYKCDRCEKAFRRKDHLVEHVRIHTGERRFQCHLCPNNFTQKAGLAHHLKTHRGCRFSSLGVRM